MTNEELKSRVGSNIARLRRDAGLTQADLAEKLNYSDKAVSKWERAESMPDLLTLVQLAELFGTDVNQLVTSEDVSGGCAAAQTDPSGEPVPRGKRIADKGIIQKLCTILVWFVALFVYTMLDSFDVRYGWITFFFAIPVNAIVLLSLRSAWHLYNWNKILISFIMWGSLLCIYLLIHLTVQVNMWRIFLLGLLGQIGIEFLFRMFPPESEENDHGEV